MIRRKIPWTSQPQYPVGIDRSGRLFNPAKLSAVIAPGSGSYLIDALTGKNYTVTSNPATGVSALGKGINWNAGTNDYIELATDADNILDTVNCSILMATVRTSSATYPAASYGYDSGAGGSDRTLLHLPYTDNNLYWDFGNATAGAGGGRLSVSIASYLAAGTINIWGFSAGSRGREIWRNGVLLASDATANFTRVATVQVFRLGAVNLGASLGAPTHIDHLFVLSKEEWSRAAFKELTESPWKIFAPQERRVFVNVASSDLNITTTLATANASGFTANIDRQLVIATSLGTATASGFTANVDRQLSITTTLATATASGFTANISSDLNVTATLATATASAFSANVDRQLSITATLATANASGSTANVDRQLFITTTLATATASGFDASIALGGGLNITATRAVATASGFVASVTISTPQGSGWETYVAPTRKKTVKQFKEEFNDLTYFELEEKEDEVKSEIRLVEQDIRLNEDLGLDNLIVKLKLALKIQKAKLQAIKSVKQEKIQEAQVQQIQHESIPIEYTQDIDIIHEDENIDADLSYIAAILRMKYFN